MDSPIKLFHDNVASEENETRSLENSPPVTKSNINACADHPQSVSDLLELDSEVSVLNDELRLGLLKIWALLVYNKGQQLVLQATLSDSEVDEGGLSLDLRGVVGVAELGVEDQFEVLVVLHILVS